MDSSISNAKIESAGSVDFVFDPTCFYYAELYLKQAIDSVEEAKRIVSQIDNYADVLDSSTYNLFANSKYKLNNIYSELDVFKNKLLQYKESILALDPSYEMVFSYLENGGSYDNSLSGNSYEESFNAMINNMSYCEQIEFYYEMYTSTRNQINGELAELNNVYNGFIHNSSDKYSNLKFYYDLNGNKIIYNPSEYKTMEMDFYNNTIATNIFVNQKEEYDKLNKKISNYIKLFEECFSAETGMSLVEYNSKVNELNEQLLQLDSVIYSLEQQKGMIPYMNISESDDYMNYVNNRQSDVLTINKDDYNVGVFSLCVNGEKVDYNTINPLDILDAIEKGIIPRENTSSFVTMNSNNANSNVSSDVVAEFVNMLGSWFTGETNTKYASSNGYEAVLNNLINGIDYAYLTDDDKMMYSYLFDTQGRSAADNYLKAIQDRVNQQMAADEAEAFINSISVDGKIDYNLWTTTLTSGKGILDGIETFGEGIGNVFRDEGVISKNQYEQMYIIQALQEVDGNFLQIIDNAQALETTYQLGSTFGNMAPTMLASMVLSTVATPAVGSWAGNILMGASAMGNAKNQALLDGASIEQATLYGFLSGSSEAIVGKLVGNIPGLNENATFCLRGLLSEGTEEFIQEYVDAGLRAGVLGQDIDVSQLLGDASKSFMYGFMLSGITNGAQLTGNVVMNGGKAKFNSVNDFADFIALMNTNSANITKFDYTDSTGVEHSIDAFVIEKDAEVENDFIDKINKIFSGAVVVERGKNGELSLLSGSKVDLSITQSVTDAHNVSDTTLSDDGEYELKDGESLRGKIGFQFFGNTKGDTAFNIPNYYSGHADMANYNTINKGRVYTIDVESFESIPSDFWSKINAPSMVYFRKDGKLYSFADAKILSGAVSLSSNNSTNVSVPDSKTVNPNMGSSVADIKSEISKLNYTKTSIPQYISDYLASNVRKFLYKNTNAFEGLNEEIMKNGLYHFTDAADAILSSGYIKSSNMNASYGTRKTFFFSGIPDIGAFATNLDSVPIKATAVRVKPTSELVNSSKLKLRYFDDMAITYEGNFDLTGFDVEKCYFGLVLEDGKLVYKQISEDVYNSYENTDMGKALSDFVSNKGNIRAIKGNFLAELSERTKNNKVIDRNTIINLVNNNSSDVDPVHGYQLDNGSFGGWFAANIKRGFLTSEQVNSMLAEVNSRGFISESAGRYYSELFANDEYDIYVKTVHSSSVDSIMQEGIRCLGDSTSTGSSVPTNISDVKLVNTVTKVHGTFDLFKILKSANGVSQGNNIIDGTMIIKVPKGTSVSDMVYFNQDTNTYNIKPELVDSFNMVDANGNVSEPKFNEVSTQILNDSYSEYELKEGESLRGKVGFQFFGGKTENSSNQSKKISEQLLIKIEEANQMSEYGEFYTFEIDDFGKIPTDFWSKIADPSTTFFRNNGKVYSFNDAKKLSQTTLSSKGISNVQSVKSSVKSGVSHNFQILESVVGGAASNPNNIIPEAINSQTSNRTVSTQINFNVNDFLSNIVSKIGDNAARKALFFYVNNGDISGIPVEFRNYVKKLSSDDINGFLESYKKNNSSTYKEKNDVELKQNYSDYTLDQILEDCKNYREICDMFFSLATDLETRHKLEHILYTGGYNGYNISSKNSSKDNPFVDMQRRISMANLLLTNPDTFDVLVQSGVNLFHGTNSSALGNILKYGLNNYDELVKKNISVSTGEQSTRTGGRNFISFTDVLDVAGDYSLINSDSSSFEVIVGTTVDDAKESSLFRPGSDIPEVGLRKGLPVDKIKVICVPSNYVDYVKNLLPNDKIQVLAIDCINNKFYDIDAYSGLLNIDYNQFDKINSSLKINQGIISNFEDSANILQTAIDSVDLIYGKNFALNQLYDYIINGQNPSVLPVIGNFRNVVTNMDYNSLVECYNIINNSHNEVITIKDEILNTMPKGLDKLSMIRYLYLELNKRISYDVGYFKSSQEVKNSIYNQDVSFDTLVGNKVICRGWSQLFYELLLSAGIDSSSVKIQGSNKVGAHKWVEIEFDDYIIRADATDAFNHNVDISASKAGLSTNGFIAIDKSLAGVNISKVRYPNSQVSIYEDLKTNLNDMWLRNIDAQLGYNNNGQYFDETVNSLIESFYSPNIVERIFGVDQNKLTNMKLNMLFELDFPQGMNSYDAYAYLRQVRFALFGNNGKDLLDVHLYGRKTSSSAVPVGVMFMLKHNMDGSIECRGIDDEKGEFTINFNNIADYYSYVDSFNYSKIGG